MRVVVGLGNPGEEYRDTRHNAGFLLADALVERWGFPAFRRSGRARATEGSVDRTLVLVLEPTTYMNRSGAALAPFVADPEFHPETDLLVLVDDAALPSGTFRLRARGSAGGHNGLKSVQGALQSLEYARLRVGVGPVPPDVDDLADWVLAPLTSDERAQLDEMLPTLVDAVECWVRDGIDEAMNRFNRVGSDA